MGSHLAYIGCTKATLSNMNDIKIAVNLGESYLLPYEIEEKILNGTMASASDIECLLEGGFGVRKDAYDCLAKRFDELQLSMNCISTIEFIVCDLDCPDDFFEAMGLDDEVLDMMDEMSCLEPDYYIKPCLTMIFDIKTGKIAESYTSCAEIFCISDNAGNFLIGDEPTDEDIEGLLIMDIFHATPFPQEFNNHPGEYYENRIRELYENFEEEDEE